MPNMRTQFELTHQDCSVLLALEYRGKWYGLILWLMPFVGISLVLFGVIGVFLQLHSGWGWVAVVIVGVVLVLGRSVLIVVASERRRKPPQRIDMAFDDSCVVITTRGVVNRYNWSDFSHYSETRKHFLLYLSSGVILVPKRAFASQELSALGKL
jgi:MFS family permease